MNNTEYTNDLSLLRPFDLEAAKNGEYVCDANDCYTFKFLTYSKSSDLVYCQLLNHAQDHVHYNAFHMLRMKPLAWIEGKPVYKGDVLWYNGYNFSIEVTGPNPYEPKHGLKGIVNFAEGNSPCGYTGCGKEETWAPFNSWTWNKPKQKVKRKIWINVYPDDYFTVYKDKYEADNMASINRLACVETEIEY